MNIIEILATIPPALSNIVLGTQVVMLDVGGFSLASMGEHAREHGNEAVARKASVTGNFLIVVTIVTLLLVSIGLLWPAARVYTTLAEKGLILVRVVMTVIYGHVIHSLRRSAMQRQTPQQAEALRQQVEAVTTAFNQQREHLAAELAHVQQHVHVQLASELASIRDSLQQHLAAELSAMHTGLHQYEEALASLPAMQAHLQPLESSTVAETQKRGAWPGLRVLPPVQQQGKNEGSRRRRVQETGEAAPQTARAEKFDARAFVFACLEECPDLKLAEIEQLALARNQELSQSTASRYRMQFFAKRESASLQAKSPATSIHDAPLQVLPSMNKK